MKKFSVFAALFTLIFIFSSLTAYAGQWVNVDTNTTKVWVDTSHYETRQVWVQSGYWNRKWVDTSHYETRTEQVWVESGYYKDVWVVDVPGHYETQKVWVDTTYKYVTKYKTEYTTRTASDWGTANSIINSMQRQGWTYNGAIDNPIYNKYKELIRVDIVLSFSRKVPYKEKVVDVPGHWEEQQVWVPEKGHWEKQWVDTSHYETRQVQVWVQDGYWQDYWVDTSHYENQQVWVVSGYYGYASGTVTVTKTPPYIYTKWHVDEDKVPASMTITITVSNLTIDKKPATVSKIEAYHVINRYQNNGTETIYPVSASMSGSSATFKFEYPHAGDKNSLVNFFITASNGAQTAKIRVYAPVPVNGFQTTGMVVDKDVTPQFDKSVLDNETINF